jgi:hypothetical protein
METVKPKRGGRRPTGRDPLLQVRVPKHMIESIDRFADKFHDTDRSSVVRALVDIGLHAGRKRNHVVDPKGFRQHDRKVPLGKRRRRPRPPVLRVVS